MLVGTGQPGPFKRVSFPIADSAVEYEAPKTKETTLMPAAAMTAIDALKPYRGGHDVLWRIHRLDNVDKHRVLLTVGSNFGRGRRMLLHVENLVGWSCCGVRASRNVP